MDFYKKFNSMKVSENLFKDVKFYITGIVPEWIIQLLNNGGGKQELHITDFMTHLITGNNPIEDEIGEVRDIYEKPVVTQLWVIYCIKCDKLLPCIREDAFSPDSKQLFSGVKASVSKLGRDDSLTIWGLITFYGGKCTIDLDHTCTHLVLGKQEGIKFNRAVEKPILIVTPDWVIDSISDEERKDELYYHPKLINISGVSSNQSQNKRSRKLLSSIERRPREASPKVAIPVPPPVSFPEPTEQETKKEHSDEQSIFDSLIFTDDEEEEEVSDNESKSLLEQLTNPPPLLPTSAPNSSSEDREESPVSESISSSVHLQRSVSTTCQELSTLTRPVTSTFSMGSISAGLGSPMEAVSTSLPVVNSGDVSAGMSSSTSVVPEGDAVNSVAPATEASQTHTLMIKNGVHFSQVARVPATTGTSYSSLPPLSSSPYITQNTPSAVSSYSGTVPTTFIQGSHWQQSISTQGEEGLGGRPVIPPNKVITHSKPLNQTVGELSLPVSLSSSLPATSLTLAQPSGQQALPVHIVRPNSVTVAAGLGLLSSVPTASNTGKPFPVAAAANLLPLAGTSMQPCPQVQQAVSGVTVASSSMTQQVHSVGIPGAVVRLPAGVTHQQLQMMSNEERQRFLEQLHKKQLEEQRSAQRTGKPDTTLQYKNIPPGTIRYACPVRPQQSAQPQSPQASGTWPQSSVAQLSRVRPGSQVVTYTQGQGQVVTYTQGQVLPQTQTTTGPGWTQNPQQFPSAPGTATRVLVGQPGWQQQTPQQLTVTQQQSQTHGLSPQQLQLLHAQQLRQHFPLLTQQEAQQLIQTIPAHLRELQSRDNAGRYEYLSQLDPKEQQVVNHFYLRRHQQQMLQRQQQHLQAQHQAQQMKIGVPQQSPPWQQQQLQQQTQHQQAGQFSPGSPHSRPVPGRPVPQSYSGQTVVSPGQGSPHLVQSGQIVSQHVSPLASPHGQSPVPRQEGGGIIPHASLQGSNVPQNLVHQQNLVNPKTKTALANLLTNRLSGTVHQGVVVPPGSQGPIEVAAHLVQKPGMPQEGVQAVGDQVIIYQRRTLANITGTVTNNIVRPSGPTTVGSSSSPLYPRAIPVGQGGSTPAMAASTPHYMRPHLFGHDINTMLPRELCMVGCVFYIADYFSDFTMDVISNWQTIIQQHGGEVVSLYDSGRVTHVLCQHQKSPVFRQAVRENKRCITIYWVNDILIRGKMAPPWQAIHLPTPFGKDEKPMKDLLVSVTGFENDERTTIKLMLDLAGAQYTGYFSKHNNLLVCKKFEGLKVNKAKELKRSVVNGAWLSEVLLGQNTPPLVFQGTRYQHYLDDPLRIDPSLASHLFNAWKCPISVSKESVEKAKAMREMALRKRKSESDGDRENKRARGVDPSLSGPLSAGQSDSKSTIQLENDPTEERSCESQSRMQHPRIMLSSIKNKEEMEKKIIDMGGHMARANSEMSHLVMGASEAAPRTVKLLCALSCAQYIVSIQWLIDSSKQCKFLDERRYSLRMPEFERVFRFSLTEVMLKNRRRELFAGRHFFLTPSVVPGRSWLKEIIECAGGAVDVKRKSLREIRERNKDGKCQYICICSDEDSHLVNDLISERMPIFNSEFVMVSLMTQEMDWKATIFRPACVKWEDHSFLG